MMLKSRNTLLSYDLKINYYDTNDDDDDDDDLRVAMMHL